ncbi:hypothetical protein FVE85_3581 [Porphyridium purpureum]|uniref:UspA domain-containing protein n=1 Tax=Porphyridium purpureum TaxID=35688 RepID=A0A5J4YN91_PORPP|nr:hypothetical protein FVE85_3581 [Porphyridium purpureum]|eukprot:POR5127..scf249_10
MVAQRGRVILALVDGSPAAENAVRFYAQTIMRSGDEVRLTHYRDSHANTDLDEAAMFAKLDSYIQEVEGVENVKIVHHTGMIRESKAELCRAIDAAMENPGEGRTALIVMGSRGLTTLDKIKLHGLGGTSDYVAKHSTHPVMLLSSDISVPHLRYRSSFSFSISGMVSRELTYVARVLVRGVRRTCSNELGFRKLCGEYGMAHSSSTPLCEKEEGRRTLSVRKHEQTSPACFSCAHDVSLLSRSPDCDMRSVFRFCSLELV